MTSVPDLKEFPALSINRIQPDMIKRRQTPRSQELFAEMTPEVTSRIDKIATEYSSALDKNMSPNVLEELSLLIQMIVSSQPLTEHEVESGTNIRIKIGQELKTTAQQVYFVLKVFALQLDRLLLSVDPTIIQLLVEKYPHKIPKIVRKEFQSWVENQTCMQKDENGDVVDKSRKPSEFHHCVTFRSEEDGRSNFPSQGDFHAFCKQRDMFYAVKSLWLASKQESNNGAGADIFGRNGSSVLSLPVVNYNKSSRTTVAPRPVDPLKEKVLGLFALNSSWANLSHLAALFTSQFVIDSLDEEAKSNEGVKGDLMKVLRDSNPDRLAKLASRMFSSSEKKEVKTSSEAFTFLCYFLTASGSPGFNQHVADRVSYEIRQVELSMDSSGSGSEEDRELLFKKSILMAKVLGYVTFLPYREDIPVRNANFAPNVLDKEAFSMKHIDVRLHHKPPLELKDILLNALARKRLAFTLPWVLEFLRAADVVSLHLPAYKEILAIICRIYQSVLIVDASFSSLTIENKNLLRFWCGQFFSNSSIASAMLFDREALSSLPPLLSSGLDPSVNNPHFLRKQHSDDENDVSVDFSSPFGRQLGKLYFSTTFIQIKNVIHSGVQSNMTSSPFGSMPKSTHRHIKPIPAKLIKRHPANSEAEIQRQLECSFFDSHSPSVKRTVDFVSERVASNYVKLLRKTMADQRAKLILNNVFGEEAAGACRKFMLEGSPEFIDSKCESSVTVLIGDSLSQPALKICIQITERQTLDKIAQWVNMHIKEEMFPEMAVPEVKLGTGADQPSLANVKPQVLTNVPKENGTEPHPEKPASFTDIILLQRTMKIMHEGKPASMKDLDAILNHNSLGKVNGIIATLIDFGISVVSFHPSILTEDRICKLLALWRPQWNTAFCHILSPRNIKILNEHGTPESWKKLQQVIVHLLNENFLDFQTVEEDCFRLLREDLSSSESQNVSILLRNLVSDTGSTPNSQSGDIDRAMSREVVDWISWYCSDDQHGQF